ncbi:hypothetical protein BN129_2698 [Cronobacter sakazakii 701]|nr:hypothetical protein BN129_2698 [Cronobacter sakazakii 701]
MQLRGGRFYLFFNLAQRKAVGAAFIPVDFIVDDMKVKAVLVGDTREIRAHRRVMAQHLASPATAGAG